MSALRAGGRRGLLDKRAISQELVQKLLAWRHPGFSAHVGEPIMASDKQRLEDTAAYLVRNPLSLKKLVYLDGRQAVLYRSRMNPSLGRNFEAMDPLEWLARMSDHIPDPGQHRTIFYGEYSSRVRATLCAPEAALAAPDLPPRRRCSPSWARTRLEAIGARAGGPLKVVAYISDSLAIRQILDHLDLSPPEKPPPDIRDLVCVPVDEDGREIESQPA